MTARNLYAQESYINKSAGHSAGEQDWYETGYDTIGALYRALQREHGRGIGKAYFEHCSGVPVRVGWVFEKRARYEDARDRRPESYYALETWVSVSTTAPRRVVTVKDVTSPWRAWESLPVEEGIAP